MPFKYSASFPFMLYSRVTRIIMSGAVATPMDAITMDIAVGTLRIILNTVRISK